MARPVLAARHADAHEIKGVLGGFAAAAFGIGIIGVAGVDDQIARPQQGAQRGDLVVNHRTGRDHQDDRARRRDGGDKVLQRLRGRQPHRQIASPGDEGVGDGGGAVIDGNRIAIFGDVQCQRSTHGAKADQAEMGGIVHDVSCIGGARHGALTLSSVNGQVCDGCQLRNDMPQRAKNAPSRAEGPCH